MIKNKFIHILQPWRKDFVKNTEEKTFFSFVAGFFTGGGVNSASMGNLGNYEGNKGNSSSRNYGKNTNTLKEWGRIIINVK